ncbi:MAG: SurA N-terminal domain-containing protein [Muribaculum sp.]|nr:SurA N-terminal domain-containing protein [Muribaculum sp.]
MATLEKIRKRSTLLLIVVGAALLAFIIGDFFTSGRTLFGTGTTIAKVGDEKIDIQDFQRRYEEANQMYQQQGAKMDPAALQQRVLYGMIQEQLLDKEINDLGIEVSDNELTQAMLGPDAHYAMIQFAQNMGFESPSQLYDVAFNPGKYGVPEDQARQVQQMWLKQEQQMEMMLKQQKFQNLLVGSLVANELDAKAYYDGNAATSHIAYAKKSYSDLPNDKYPVSDSEIKAEYDKQKNAYKVDEEMRRVSYIAVNIEPSTADVAEARKLVDATVANLAATNDLEAVNGDSNFGVDRRSTTLSAITNPQLKNFVADSVTGAVTMLSFINDEFTIAKNLGKKVAVDSINVDLVAYQGDAAGRDSLLAALNSGTPFEEALKMPGVVGGQADVWNTLASTPDNELKEKLLNAGSGYFISDSTANDARIVRVNSKKAPVAIYDYATVTYKVYPSDATVAKLNDDLQEFMSGVTKADSLTIAKAIKAGYALQPAMLTANSATLGNVPYTRNAVKWAMDAKRGEVSPILEDGQNDRLIVVALNEIIKPGFMPISDDIKTALTEKVRNDKKAADLIAQYKGKASDIAGYAGLMQANVDSTEVTFGQMFIAGIGAMESNLLGQVPVTPKGVVTGPLQGNNGVYVYQVYEVDNQSRPYNYQENAARYNQQFGGQAVLQNFFDIMMEDNKVVNNTLKFYND